MTRITVEATVEQDGELHLRDLPCRKGDRVEATLVIPSDCESTLRETARQRFLQLAKSSQFSSTGEYPTRDQLHVRD